MRRGMGTRGLVVLVLLLAALGCGRKTGTLRVVLLREDDLNFTAENGTKLYPIVLSEGLLVIDDVNLVDDRAPGPVLLLEEQVLYDFASSPTLELGEFELPTKEFQQIHVFYADGVGLDPAVEGLALLASGQVRLTDGSQVPFDVELSLERDAQEILASIPIRSFRDRTVELKLDLGVLFGKLDFDGLGAGGSVGLFEGSGEAAVEAALSTLRENLVRALRFDGAQGGDISG